MEKIFMIADTHFGDENIIKFEGRPFKSVKEMNQTMIENWNSVVSDEDTVFVLGDFSIDNRTSVWMWHIAGSRGECRLNPLMITQNDSNNRQ